MQNHFETSARKSFPGWHLSLRSQNQNVRKGDRSILPALGRGLLQGNIVFSLFKCSDWNKKHDFSAAFHVGIGSP